MLRPDRSRYGVARVAVPLPLVLAVLLAAPLRAQPVGNIERGRVYAERVCAECHAVRPGDIRSPHPDATPFSIMARVPGLNERALSVFLRTPHAKMPNLIVSEEDQDDLIAYFMTMAPQR